MTKRLKEKFMDEIDDPNVTYDQLADKAIIAANRYKAIDLESQTITQQVRSAAASSGTGNRIRERTPFTSTTPAASGTADPVKNSPVSTPAATPVPSGRGRMSNELRDALRKNGLCFYCQQPGHTTRTCPKKTADLSLIAASAANSASPARSANLDRTVDRPVGMPTDANQTVDDSGNAQA